MPKNVTRRDFLDGLALAVAGAMTLSPRQLLAQAGRTYPPALMGLRGSTDAAFQVMHGLARDGVVYSIDGMKDEETYDLVVSRRRARGTFRRLVPAGTAP